MTGEKLASLLNDSRDEIRRELMTAVPGDYPINDCVDDVLTDKEQK